MGTGDGLVEDGLEGFLPAVSDWFRRTLGTPTEPQRRAWPEVAAGRHTLVCAPTGSGKTLAAFLACLDHLWRRERTGPGVRLLYISPLKALNEDIARNLDAPLAGIVATAGTRGERLPELRVAVRTGDTPPAERQRIARRPPEILITTPESLHLMLTSRAREGLRGVSHVIVDEIHALAPNKRGVFLSLLLERLDALNPSSFVRIGLSATQRPLDEVARFLGGRRRVGPDQFEPRPVSIIDAGLRKALDLEVSLPALPMLEGSVWPAIEERLGGLIDAHRSTIVFTNNRRVAERLTARLNERGQPDEEERADAPDETMSPVVSHHGSLSLERRRAVESALKSGTIRAVVATASLELGIDMGAVDLVCQVESPGSVARGLQRVGRAGHLVGVKSRGRLLSKTPGDLLETAALARAMTAGEVEPLRVPTNCLDVLAQQVVACVAQDRTSVPALFDLVRGAYPYRDLTASTFESVLELVSGRFAIETFRDLRPRISWDRVHNTLHPLPGTLQLAVVGGGTIPDTGQFPLYLGESGPRLGELDEEFVLERRVGETFVLGTATWRIESIDAQRVVVSPAEGRSAMLPFWRGESSQRSGALGDAVGALCREVAERVDDPDTPNWLQEQYHLDARSSQVLRDLIARQLRLAGAVPDDRTVLIETFVDPAGELGLAVLTPWGGSLHHALKLALQASLRRRLGIEVAALHHDEGILLRLPQMEEPPLDLFDGLTPERAERFLREELAESALFGLRFRQNAGRALLLPRPDPGKRTPLWLQRLRAKDLLQAVRQFPDFPIVIETFRECLNDDLDLPRLRALLGGIADGSIRVATRRGEIASPFASGLIFAFSSKFLYEWDEPKRVTGGRGVVDVSREALDAVLDPESISPWLDPAAIGRVEGRLREAGRPPRTEDEMAERLRRLGDLAVAELSGPMAAFLSRLEASGRAVRITLERTSAPDRWIDAEDLPVYQAAFGAACQVLSEGARTGRGPVPDPETSRSSLVRRFLRTHALVGLAELTTRFPIAPDLAAEQLDAWSEDGQLVRVDPESPDEAVRWADRRNLQEVRRIAVALRRRESVAVSPEVFAGFVLERQHVAPSTRLEGAQALPMVLEGLAGLAAPADLLEREFLPRRLRDYRPTWLDDAMATGGWTWRAATGSRGELNVAVVPREFAGRWPDLADGSTALDPDAEAVWSHLQSRGASFSDDVAREMGMAPGAVRVALRTLAWRGMVTNDRFDPVRDGGEVVVAPASGASPRNPAGRPRLRGLRRPLTLRPEGRWVSLTPGAVSEEESALAWAAVLLARYGVLTRETAAADPWAPPWRELAPVLSAAELRGEVRRGYFVEGLSGVQYALPETAEALALLAGMAEPDMTPVLLNSLDPANLYGIGAPLDIPLLEGGTARFSRNAANFLVLRAGRPVLMVENFGKRLTGLASASESELREAVALLPTLAGPSRRVLKVETYNLAPTLSSPAAPWLSDLGFVRDPPGMAYYAGWS